MKKQKERVLAYTQARELTKEELQRVSGGMHMSQHSTLHPSSSAASNSSLPTDFAIDYSIDF